MDGTLGAAMLSHPALYLDYRNRRLAFIFPGRLSPTDIMGLGMEDAEAVTLNPRHYRSALTGLDVTLPVYTISEAAKAFDRAATLLPSNASVYLDRAKFTLLRKALPLPAAEAELAAFYQRAGRCKDLVRLLKDPAAGAAAQNLAQQILLIDVQARLGRTAEAAASAQASESAYPDAVGPHLAATALLLQSVAAASDQGVALAEADRHLKQAEAAQARNAQHWQADSDEGDPLRALQPGVVACREEGGECAVLRAAWLAMSGKLTVARNLLIDVLSADPAETTARELLNAL